MPSKLLQTSYRYNYRDILKVNGVVVLNQPGSFNVTKSISSVTQTIKDWKRRIKVEPVLTGELHVVIAESNRGVDRPEYWWETTTSSTSYRREGVVTPTVGAPNYDVSLTDRTIDKTSKRMLNKYHAETRSLQGLVSLGEMRETLRLLRRPADAILSATIRYERTKMKLLAALKRLTHIDRGHNAENAIKRLISRLVDEYLGYMFGILPLIGDAERVAKFYNTINERKTGFKVIKATDSSISSPTPPVVRVFDSPYGARITSTRFTLSRCDVKMRAALHVQAGPGPAALEVIRQSGTLDYREVLPAIWELLPLSFISDYFSNIGDVIDGWSFGDCFPQGLQQTIIRRAYQTETGFTISSIPGSGFKLGQSSISSRATYRSGTKRIDRERLPALPVPSLRFELLGAGDSAKYHNMAALLQARGRKIRSNGSSGFWSQGVDL